ncbi:ammonia channel [Microbulbifer aestuariivivens]|uniref:Ammonium transporter n=1 Tax=Microbulbifer aestuariivivens TaxID=1908308 RepID=A0ABP9WV97_9GAMM
MDKMFNSGDTGFVMVCTALVLLMTPALAFFYGGMVRRRDVLSIMMQTFVCMGLVAMIWLYVGFSLVFGADLAGIIGNPLTYFALSDVGSAPNPNYGPTVPFILFFAYQMMFAIIAPGLITGSFVSRFKMTPYILYVIFWTLLIYAPIAHWVWGGGFLQKLGVVDFAGGIVIHLTAGISALTTAYFIGARAEDEKPQQASNIPLIAIGSGLLWFGWFGFNSGGAYAADDLAAYAFANTTLAASAALLTWLFWQWRDDSKPSFTGILVGSVAGLATITPAAGYVEPWSAPIFGVVGATACYFARGIQRLLKVDDALEVFRAHGVGGITGALLIGIFARSGVDKVSAGVHQFGVQLLAVIIVAIYTALITWLILFVINKFISIRPSSNQEALGLDSELLDEENS